MYFKYNFLRFDSKGRSLFIIFEFNICMGFLNYFVRYLV